MGNSCREHVCWAQPESFGDLIFKEDPEAVFNEDNNNNNNNNKCLNPIAWKFKATERYKLYPISLKMTDLLSIDDLKVFAASQIKLRRVLRSVKDDVECVGLKWNKKKCAVAQTGCEQRVFDSRRRGLED